MPDFPQLDPKREQEFSRKGSEQALGRADPVANMEKMAAAVNSMDKNVGGLLIDLSATLRRYAETVGVYVDQANQQAKKSAAEAADAVEEALSKAGAVTGKDIDKLSDKLVDVMRATAEVRARGEAGEPIVQAQEVLKRSMDEFGQTLADATKATKETTQAQKTQTEEIEKAAREPARAAAVEEPYRTPGALGELRELGVGRIAAGLGVAAATGIGGAAARAGGFGRRGTERMVEHLKRIDTKVGDITPSFTRGLKKLGTSLTGGLGDIFRKTIGGAMGSSLRVLGFLVGIGVAMREQLAAGWKWIQDNWANLPGILGEAWDKAVPKIADALMGAINWVVDILPDSVFKALKSFFEDPLGHILDALKWAGQKIVDVYEGITSIPQHLKEALWASSRAERMKREAAEAKLATTKEIISGGGVRADVFLRARAAGASEQQAYRFASMADTSPQGAQAAVAEFGRRVSEGENVAEAVTAVDREFIEAQRGKGLPPTEAEPTAPPVEVARTERAAQQAIRMEDTKTVDEMKEMNKTMKQANANQEADRRQQAARATQRTTTFANINASTDDMGVNLTAAGAGGGGISGR